ncbi:MAG: efflux RND transporter periplasmic adaptor subunit [Candidatus Hydrogenedentes bacterium]|nr:efflux RND transporter periplasmic adaptor subunit [Candidatus Hydrogenedentota bacterium]
MHTFVRMLVLVVMALAVAACNGKIAANNAEASAKSPDASKDKEQDGEKDKDTELIIPVQAEYPQRGEISGYFETNTRVEAERHVDVTSEGVGKCEQIAVEEGAHVEKGDVLAKLDTEETEAALRQGQIQVKQQKANLERTKKMFDEGLASAAELDNAQFGYDQTSAGLDMQKIRLNNMTIKAPISGVITRRNIQVGMLVTTGAPAFSIVDPASFVLTINPPEKQLQSLTIGQTANITVDSISGEEFTATVRRINPNVDQGQLKVTLDIEKAAREKLREGAFARVRLVMDTHKNALLVPKDAIVEENARKYLFLAKNTGPSVEAAPAAESDKRVQLEPASDPAPSPKPSTDNASDPPAAAAGDAGVATPRVIAERVEVGIGLDDKGLVEIVSGLSDKDLVIVRGQQTLKPKSPISVTTEERELKAKANIGADEALASAEAKRKAGAKSASKRPKRKF